MLLSVESKRNKMRKDGPPRVNWNETQSVYDLFGSSLVFVCAVSKTKNVFDFWHSIKGNLIPLPFEQVIDQWRWHRLLWSIWYRKNRLEIAIYWLVWNALSLIFRHRNNTLKLSLFMVLLYFQAHPIANELTSANSYHCWLAVVADVDVGHTKNEGPT